MKPRSDCQPKSDFVHIRMESDLNNWLSTQHIATVHIRFVDKRSFVFTECALVPMVMPLPCYAYAKNNSNSNTICNTDVLPSRLCCIIIFRLVRQRQKCRKLCGFIPCCSLRYFPFFFFFFFLSATFKTQRGACTSGILFFPAWLALHNDTSLFLQRCSACFLQKGLTYLRFTWCEDVKKLR